MAWKVGLQPKVTKIIGPISWLLIGVGGAYKSDH